MVANVKVLTTPHETVQTTAPVMIADAGTLLAVRQVLMTVGGILAGKGWVTNGDVEMYVGAIMLIIPIVWQWYNRSQAK